MKDKNRPETRSVLYIKDVSICPQSNLQWIEGNFKAYISPKGAEVHTIHRPYLSYGQGKP